MMHTLEAPPRIASIGADDDRYQVHGRLEIAAILRRLIAQRSHVTVHAGDHGAFFVTAVLALDDSSDSLICDYGVDAGLTERLLRSARITFVTQLDHVRIQFSASGAERIDYEGGPAFRIAVPDVVTRLQRRDFYRLRIPRGRPLYCEVKLPADPAAPETSKRVAFPVYDISCGGLALIGWPEAWQPGVGVELADSWIDLPDLGRFVADLRIVHVEGTEGRGPGAGRFGCRFLRANPGAAMLVQRYINRIEREQRALM
jgi:c-di-GMP-binding flagellar brake protein YcgR